MEDVVHYNPNLSIPYLDQNKTLANSWNQVYVANEANHNQRWHDLSGERSWQCLAFLSQNQL